MSTRNRTRTLLTVLALATVAGACANAGPGDPPPVATGGTEQSPGSTYQPPGVGGQQPAAAGTQSPGGGYQAPGSTYQPPGGSSSGSSSGSASSSGSSSGSGTPGGGSSDCPVCGTYSCTVTSQGGTSTTTYVLTPINPTGSCLVDGVDIVLLCGGGILDLGDDGGTTETWSSQGTTVSASIDGVSYVCTKS
ncbi:MAG: hypothetical protein ACLQVI_20780 [Polyangiaceae bacterium]|jgi:hypothetical protein